MDEDELSVADTEELSAEDDEELATEDDELETEDATATRIAGVQSGDNARFDGSIITSAPEQSAMTGATPTTVVKVMTQVPKSIAASTLITEGAAIKADEAAVKAKSNERNELEAASRSRKADWAASKAVLEEALAAA
jgi:hypothetical protein